MRHPHFYFQRRVLIVGAGADAQAAALQCASVARRVYLCCAELELSPTPGQSDLRPQLIELIQSGKVEYLANREITGLSGRKVTLSGPGRQRNELEIDFLISQPGRHPDYSLFQRLGVALKGTQMAPVHDPETMESNVPGIYIAGSIALGSGSAQRAISQGKKHNKRIIADLWAKTTGRAVVERQRALPVATATQSWWPPQLPTDAPALGVGS
jgi:thioredoxin reductase (NADPH)